MVQNENTTNERKLSKAAKRKLWQELQPWIKDRGYLLPVTYTPTIGDIKPSKLDVATLPEDAHLPSKVRLADPRASFALTDPLHSLFYPQSDRLILGTRTRDGTPVILKWYQAHPDPAHGITTVPPGDLAEAAAVSYFFHPARNGDPRNHCLRVLSWIVDVDKPHPVGAFVTPLLRRWNDEPLKTVGEAVTMLAQLAEVRFAFLFLVS